MKLEIEMRMSNLKDFECLVGVISRNPSEKRSVKSFPPKKIWKTPTNQALAPTKRVFCIFFVGVSEQKTPQIWGSSNCSLKLQGFRYGNTGKGTSSYIVQKILKNEGVSIFRKHVHLFSQLKFSFVMKNALPKSRFPSFRRKSEFLWEKSALDIFQLQCIFLWDKCKEKHRYSWGRNATSYITRIPVESEAPVWEMFTENSSVFGSHFASLWGKQCY